MKTMDTVNTFKTYWTTPPKGKYVPYKEIAVFGGAGFGVHWASVLFTVFGLDAGNLLIGHALGMRPTHLATMLIAANLAGIPIAFFRGWFIDNHKFPGGKFIPIMLRTPVPLLIISTIFVWLPFEHWEYNTKAVVIWFMYMLVQFFLCFYLDAWNLLQQVLTPNVQERVEVMSLIQIIYSLAPSITTFLLPTLAAITFGNTNIYTYRIIYPPFTLIGIIVLFIFMPKVKERIILPKQKVEYISLIDALREVGKNKYYWIINSAGWVGFLENAYGVILSWTLLYSCNGEREILIGPINTILGNAALWSMMVVPFLVRAIGKRNLLIYHNIANIFLLIALYFCYENLILLIAIFYINSFINTLANVYLPAINADMRDYHQWKTGVRIDGMFGPLGTIGTVLSFGTGLVVPAIYEYMGLKEDYTVLYDDVMRNNLFEVLLFIGIIGAILNLIPYLFYDLTETKHRGYINVLKIRAMFEDYGNGELENEQLVEAMEIINAARERSEFKKLPIDKTELKRAKAMPKKTEEEMVARFEAIKAAKEKIKEAQYFNDFIVSLPIVLEEIGKFSTERYEIKLIEANKIIAKNKSNFYTDWKESLSEARSMPKTTREEKIIRSDLIHLAKEKRRSEKLLKKSKGACLERPDESIKKQIQDREISTMSDRIKARSDLKAYTKALSLHKRYMQPYTDANNLVVQNKNYGYFAEIEALYQKVKADMTN